MVGNVTSGWMPGEAAKTDTANTATTSVIMVQTGVLVKTAHTAQYYSRKTFSHIRAVIITIYLKPTFFYLSTQHYYTLCMGALLLRGLF
jgi:hypothetical protein